MLTTLITLYQSAYTAGTDNNFSDYKALTLTRWLLPNGLDISTQENKITTHSVLYQVKERNTRTRFSFLPYLRTVYVRTLSTLKHTYIKNVGHILI